MKLPTDRLLAALTFLATNETLTPHPIHMNVPRSCVLYARKSTDREDKQILSIPSQIRALREFATRSGLTITHELVESCSARRPGRPIFSKLLKDAEAGRVERVLSWRLDRLARNPVDGGQLIFLLGEGVLKELITPEGSYTGAGDSKFMLSVLFGAATKMTDDLSAGVKRGSEDVLKAGRLPGCPPLGYIKVRDRPGFRGAGKVVPDPERFEIVQRMWKDMASGTTTVAEVWRRATEEWGLASRETRGANRVVPSVTTLYGMFRNPFYAGIMRYGAKRFEGEHKPMVTLEEFDRVQELIRPAETPRPSRHDFMYRGLLRCSLCARLLVGERITKRSGLAFTYYRCGRRRQGYPACPGLAPREDSVTGIIDHDLARLAVPERVARWTLEALERFAQLQRGHAAERKRAVEQELARAEQQLDKLTDYLIRGVLDEKSFVARRDEAQSSIAVLRKELDDPEATLARWREAVAEALSAGCRIADVLNSKERKQRRALLAQLYENLLVDNRIVQPHLRFPFILLEDAASLRTSLPEGYENQLPAPEVVLNKHKSAFQPGSVEDALSQWCTHLDSNQGPFECESNALTN